MKIKVTEEMRLDKFLSQNTSYSRNIIKQMIDNDLITVNGELKPGKYTVKIDDEIEIISELEKSEINLIAQDLKLDIVYEDDDLLVVNKPSNMVVHPAPGHPDKTLVNGLLHAVNSLSQSEDVRPGIVHRIDKDTSGLLMVAKNDYTHAKLQEQLKDKSTFRKYVAIVHGVINENEATIDAPIGIDKTNRQRRVVTSENSKDAVTHIKVIKRFINYTLIECQLETGRTHQIRVHLKYIKHPVVGDPIYGPKRTIDTKGQALHASDLGFIHPTTNEYMEFHVDLPEEFNKTIAYIEENDGYN